MLLRLGWSGRACDHGGMSTSPAEPEWKRRARLARIFGEELPETTSDEREPSEEPTDAWLRAQVPPHHGH